MEDISLHEVEDDVHSSGHPAGHAVAGELSTHCSA